MQTFNCGFVVFLTIFLVNYACLVYGSGLGSVDAIKDVKELKRVIKAHNNVLVVFGKTKKSTSKLDKMLNDVSSEMIGRASIVTVDCSAQRKICKAYKAKPDPFVMQHYHDGKFNQIYSRQLKAKSLKAFLEDPTGDIPWDEDPNGQSVTHLNSYQDMVNLVQRNKSPVLLMFYAPWCGHCKRLKPEYAAAAAEVKDTVIAAMDVDKPENSIVRQQFNITGYPTIVYIKDGAPMFYGGGFTKDAIIAWLRNPEPPKPPEPERDWSDETDDVTFLTDNNFITTLANQPSALVMFYAPWCGHCKSMKPAYQSVAKAMKQQGITGLLAAVDATKYRQAAEKYKVTGFPSVKYFQHGEYKFDFNGRSEEKIMEFMKDPKEPPAPVVEKPWASEASHVKHLTAQDFESVLKKKRRTLVMFYAPWCGHCKRAKPEFTSAAEQLLQKNPKSALAAVDCTTESQLCQSAGVNGYPTIKHYYFGKAATDYNGGRTSRDFVNFMTDDSKVEL